MAKNILLTGATGFIGSQVLSRLIEDNYNVVALLRPTSNTWRIEHLKGTYVAFTILDANMGFDDVFEKNNIDTIIHTATEYGRTTPLSSILNGNVIFPIKLIEAGLKYKLKRFINTDTFLCKDTYHGTYLKYYAESKSMIKKYLIDYSTQIQVDSLMLEHPYGEHDAEGKFVTMLIKSFLQNKKEIDFTSGNQKRDFIYVADVVEAYLKVLQKEILPTPGFDEYEVGTGSSITVREFVERVAKVFKSNTILNFGALPGRQGEMPDSFADISKLKELGWEPHFNIESAMQRIMSVEKSIYDNTGKQL